MNETQWYYAKDNNPIGPISEAELDQLARLGELRPTDMLFRDGTSRWIPASSVKDLFPIPQTITEQGGIPPFTRLLERCARSAWHHVRRAFAWDLRGIVVVDEERAHFAATGAHHPDLQRYLAWRRSVLFVVCLPVAFLALLSMADNMGGDHTFLSGLGRLWLAVQILVPFALPVSVIAAAIMWSNQRVSRSLIVYGWAISFLVPLALLLVPAHWLLDFHLSKGPDKGKAELVANFGFGLYAFTLLCLVLPIFTVSMAFGVQRACLRLKTLFPESILPGLFLVMAAPVFPLVLLPFFVLVQQLASNWLLVLGMLLLMSSPLVYLIKAKLFVRLLMPPEAFESMWRARWVALSLFWLGVLLLVAYAMNRVWLVPKLGGVDELFTSIDRKTLLGFGADTSLMRPWDWRLVRWLVIETVARSMFTTVLVADLLVRINQAVWSYNRDLSLSPRSKVYDLLMTSMEQEAPSRDETLPPQ